MTMMIIQYIERLNNSRYGNPRYRVHFTDGSVALTQSDSQFAYCVGNSDMREGSPVTVEYTRAGRISHMRPNPEA